VLAAFRAIFILIPTILEALQKLLLNLNSLVETQRDELLNKRLKEGVKKAVVTKDTSDLENTLRGKR